MAVAEREEKQEPRLASGFCAVENGHAVLILSPGKTTPWPFAVALAGVILKPSSCSVTGNQAQACMFVWVALACYSNATAHLTEQLLKHMPLVRYARRFWAAAGKK